MGNVSGKNCTENQNTHFTINNYIFFFRKSDCCENVKKYFRAGQAINDNWRTRIACWISNATHKHSEYVIRIAFFCNNYCANTPHCYNIYTLPVFC